VLPGLFLACTGLAVLFLKEKLLHIEMDFWQSNSTTPTKTSWTANQLCSDLAIEDSDVPIGEPADSTLNMPIKMFRRRNKKNVPTVGVAVRRSSRIKKKSVKNERVYLEQ
jgi:hypothetical protein